MTVATALDRVQARLAAAEAAFAAGDELQLDDLESCVDALCRESASADDAARAATSAALESLLVRLDALESAIVGRTVP